MLFLYSAKTKTGEIVESTLEANDRFVAAREIKSMGLVPLSISEKREGFKIFSKAFSGFFSRVSVNEKILFTKNLSGMLKAGLSLYRALLVLQKQTRNAKFNTILSSLATDINSGQTFYSALSKFPGVFSNLFISMTRAGEESGNLVGALSDVGLNLEKAHSLTKKIRGALIYPSVILSAMVVIGVLMFAFVVPTLAGTFKELGVTLPLSTQILIFAGNFFSSHLILTFVIIIGLGVGMFLLFRARFMGPIIDYVIIKIPIVSTLVKELNTARTARTISSLLFSGVSLGRSLEITEDVVQNVYYKKVLEEAKIAIEKGASFSKVFQSNTKLYPIMMGEMIEVGEETGRLSDMLVDIALFYEEEVENKTKNLSTIIEPLLMIVIGAAVGFFAISMISPLYSILGNIS